MFKFTQQEQDVIKAHVNKIEEEFGEGELSICQLFENDSLYYLTNRDDMPEDLGEIDFSFLNRPFE